MELWTESCVDCSIVSSLILKTYSSSILENEKPVKKSKYVTNSEPQSWTHGFNSTMEIICILCSVSVYKVIPKWSRNARFVSQSQYSYGLLWIGNSILLRHHHDLITNDLPTNNRRATNN